MSREGNPNLHEATTIPLAIEYWKSTKNKIYTLESMGDWEIDAQDEDINAIK